jgi:predicted SnoaL-like aldol condensation-catalyzing enzyme
MGHKLDNVISLYVDGVMGGNLPAALDRYVAEDMIQHWPDTTDGRGGLAAAYQPLVNRYRRRYVQPLRGFEDGSRVFLQTYQCFGYRDVERVNIDIIETDGADRLVEQWSVCAPLASVTRSGYSPIDGPAHVDDLGATAANRRTVTAYVADVMVAGHTRHVGRYVSATCVDHDPGSPAAPPGYPDGPAALPGCRGGAGDPSGGPGPHTGLAQMVGRGNFVATVSDVVVEGRPLAVGDLWRLDRGMIVEHWSVTEPGPLRRGHGGGRRDVRPTAGASATGPARGRPAGRAARRPTVTG